MFSEQGQAGRGGGGGRKEILDQVEKVKTVETSKSKVQHFMFQRSSQHSTCGSQPMKEKSAAVIEPGGVEELERLTQGFGNEETVRQVTFKKLMT